MQNQFQKNIRKNTPSENSYGCNKKIHDCPNTHTGASFPSRTRNHPPGAEGVACSRGRGHGGGLGAKPQKLNNTKN